MRPQITEQVSDFNFAEAAELQGYVDQQKTARSVRRKRITEAARLIADVAEGRTDPFFMRQAFRPTHTAAITHLTESYPGLINLRENPIGGMSITDFSILTLDVLDRILYGYWDATPVLSKPMVRQHPLMDFRQVSRYLIDGAATPPEAVPPGAPPKEKVLGPQTLIQYAPQKYEAFTRVVWEAIVNDDLGMFTDLAQRLAIGANRGIELFLTGLYVDANGPNANLYKTANKNQIITANGAKSNNPILDVQGLQDAFTVLARQLDADGYPIILTGRMYLWYGPQYANTVQNLLHMLSIQLQTQGGTGNAQGFPTQFVQTNNWMVGNITPIMNPFIRLVCTTANVQDTMWGITLDPGAQNRPAMEFGFLRGFESPQLFQKVPNTMRAGGGVDATLGDFYTMAQELKVLTVYGGKQIAGQTTVASTGAGS